MDKRTLLAIVLSLALMMGYQYYIAEKYPQKSKVTQTAEVETTTRGTDKGIIVGNAPASSRQGVRQIIVQQESLAEKVDYREKGKDITVENPLYIAVFSSQGASLKSFKLKNFREAVKKDSELVEFVNVKEGMPNPLVTTFPNSSIDLPADVIYEADADSIDLTGGIDTKRLTFSWSYKDKIRIDKVFTFYSDKYAFELEMKVHNLSDNTLNENALLSWNWYFDPDADSDRYSHVGPVSYIKGDFETEKPAKLGEKKYLGPDVSWIGLERKYFIASMIPEQPSLTSFVVSKDNRNLVSTGLEGPKNTIPPRQSGVFRYTFYIGPKDYSILKAEGVGLENSIDFGSWIKWLALPLLYVLKFIYQYVHNYGVAIIILTIFVKLLFWPLGNISYKSMKEMQKLQPQMKTLRDKHKDDKAKMQQETMALYKRHKVNPMSGCFPMVIQLPVFFGLYRALLYSIELRHSPLFFWIQDLSAKDPYYITPIVMGATMFLQQRISPT
ncbi:MAG: membrane protein insertase YidC, partial [Syntrophaceae bacterium]|nr:membrane protein insertase YidC [Syntrophaceae bacterium]